MDGRSPTADGGTGLPRVPRSSGVHAVKAGEHTRRSRARTGLRERDRWGLLHGIDVGKGNRKAVEVSYTSPEHLAGPLTPDWFRRGLSTARVVLDKTGEVGSLLTRLATLPAESAAMEAAEMFDGYLNGFYRSLKAARRGNELAARLEAAESLAYLVRLLFALEGKVAPYHSRLPAVLDTLAEQGWARGELQDRFLGILRTADPRSQTELEERVERLMRSRDYGHVVEAWDGEIERVKIF
jgi:hypothetical protein